MYRFFCQYIFLLHRHLRPKFWVSSPRQHPNYKILIPFHLIWSVRTEWFWNNIVNVVYFTLICYISGISRSVIFGKKKSRNFFNVTILVASYIEHLKSCYHISKQQGVFYLYHKYFKHLTSSSTEVRVGFFPKNDAPGNSRFLGFFSKIHG